MLRECFEWAAEKVADMQSVGAGQKLLVLEETRKGW